MLTIALCSKANQTMLIAASTLTYSFNITTLTHTHALLNPVNKANLVHNFSSYVYFFSVHVSCDYVPIIRRNN